MCWFKMPEVSHFPEETSHFKAFCEEKINKQTCMKGIMELRLHMKRALHFHNYLDGFLLIKQDQIRAVTCVNAEHFCVQNEAPK